MYEDDVKRIICITHVATLIKPLTEEEYLKLYDVRDSVAWCSDDLEVVCFSEENLGVLNGMTGLNEDNSCLMYCLVPLEPIPVPYCDLCGDDAPPGRSISTHCISYRGRGWQ
jgi:hypothetical protein